jgi:acyl-CoA reductase-like NAD-dependent aldehyde dehydrogenase
VRNEDCSVLIKNPKISFVDFIGSFLTGKLIQKAIAESEKFINCGLEMGGCDAAYVREDADIKQAVEDIADGAFFNSGQSCCGVQRILVQQNQKRLLGRW